MTAISLGEDHDLERPRRARRRSAPACSTGTTCRCRRRSGPTGTSSARTIRCCPRSSRCRCSSAVGSARSSRSPRSPACSPAAMVWVAVVRFGIPTPAAIVTVLAFSAGAPLAVYGTQVYPELPAALAVDARDRGADRSARPARALLGAGVCIVALPWLSVKYAPVAARARGRSPRGCTGAPDKRRLVWWFGGGLARRGHRVPRRAPGVVRRLDRVRERRSLRRRRDDRRRQRARTTRAARSGSSVCSSTATSASSRGTRPTCSRFRRSRSSSCSRPQRWPVLVGAARRRLAERDVRRADDARLVVAGSPSRRRAAVRGARGRVVGRVEPDRAARARGARRPRRVRLHVVGRRGERRSTCGSSRHGADVEPARARLAAAAPRLPRPHARGLGPPRRVAAVAIARDGVRRRAARGSRCSVPDSSMPTRRRRRWQ